MNLVLDSLTDDELEMLLRAENFYIKFLEPIKKGGRKYAQFAAMLGNMKSNSVLVKMNLPGIVVKQFRRKDQDFVKALEKYADETTTILQRCIAETTNEPFNIKKLESYSDEEFANLINDFTKMGEPNENRLDFDLLWIQLKLCGISIDEARRKSIIELCAAMDNEVAKQTIQKNESEKQAKKQEEIIDQVQTNTEKILLEKTVKKPKVKKLTAKEKAERNRIALENKAKAMEDVEEIDDLEADNKVVDSEDIENVVEDATNDSSYDSQKNQREEETRVYYIGRVNTIGNFYNFTPIGAYQDGNYNPFSESEVNNLLPKSQKNNINFYYNIWDQKQVNFMNLRFRDDELVVLNCDIEQLELNIRNDGQLNETGYKISAVDGCNNGKILYLSDLGLSKIIRKDNLEDNILTKRAVRLIGNSYIENETVIVNLGDGFYAGPYRIKYQESNAFYYIVTQENGNSAYIVGYSSEYWHRVRIETSWDKWTTEYAENYYFVKEDAPLIYKDLLEDKELIESFVESIEVDSLYEVKSEGIGDFIEQLGDSKVFGNLIPEDVKRERISRLKEWFTSEQQREEVMADAADFIYKMLLRNKDDSRTDELLTSIIENHPEFLDKVQGIRIVQSRLESAKQQLDELKAEATEIQADKEDRAEAELSKLDDEINNKRIELSEILKKIEQADATDKLDSRVEALKGQEKYLEQHIQNLRSDTKGLEQSFVSLINSYSDKMANITFDGFMSSKMLQSASDWERKEEKAELEELVFNVNSIEEENLDRISTIDYVVNAVQIVRPKYDRNTILNIFTCCTQGFLTVFSGMPGCGKTSICNIIAKVMGVLDYSHGNNALKGVSRYIPVSVERGWTSKRDFIGYYNPLTKSFEENNREVFTGLKVLNEEYIGKKSKYPFFILLDEANLSPMEYYWADFMNVCDDRDDNSFVNMGSNNVFYIPETLHFLATINNDHTTESLSPRLVDRAWVVTLPKNNVYSKESQIQSEVIKHLTWNNLKDAFLEAGSKTEYDREVASVLDGIKDRFTKQSVYLSPRVSMAIFDYWKVASTIMVEDEYGNQPNIIAIDYAVSQKVLPKISGSGEEYEAWLNELQDYCNGKNLMHSAEIIDDIINRGNKRMKYYDFFN